MLVFWWPKERSFVLSRVWYVFTFNFQLLPLEWFRLSSRLLSKAHVYQTCIQKTIKNPFPNHLPLPLIDFSCSPPTRNIPHHEGWQSEKDQKESSLHCFCKDTRDWRDGSSLQGLSRKEGICSKECSRPDFIFTSKTCMETGGFHNGPSDLKVKCSPNLTEAGWLSFRACRSTITHTVCFLQLSQRGKGWPHTEDRLKGDLCIRKGQAVLSWIPCPEPQFVQHIFFSASVYNIGQDLKILGSWDKVIFPSA